jgi:hypothetical protein
MLVQVQQMARFLCNHPLTRDHRAAGFARLCKWQIASRLRREVIVPWVGGIRIGRAPRSKWERRLNTKITEMRYLKGVTPGP